MVINVHQLAKENVEMEDLTQERRVITDQTTAIPSLLAAEPPANFQFVVTVLLMLVRNVMMEPVSTPTAPMLADPTADSQLAVMELLITSLVKFATKEQEMDHSLLMAVLLSAFPTLPDSAPTFHSL